MAESKLVLLNFENNSYIATCMYIVSSIVLYIQYAKPWPHSDRRSGCHQSLHAFTFRYDPTLLGCTFFAEGFFA